MISKKTLVNYWSGHARCEAARIAHQIDEGHADDAVDVEDQIGLLGRGDLFDFEGVLE